MKTKSILAAIVLSIPFAVMADNNFKCVTETDAVLELTGSISSPTTMSYEEFSAEEAVRLKANDKISVSYGEESFPSGELSYVRFTFFGTDSKLYSWVVLNGETNAASFQGVKLYDNRTLIFQDACKEYVKSPIDNEAGLDVDFEDVVEAFGEL